VNGFLHDFQSWHSDTARHSAFRSCLRHSQLAYDWQKAPAPRAPLGGFHATEKVSKSMSQELALVGLCELFVLICGIGAFRKNGKSQMSFMGAAIFSFGILLVSIGIRFIRGDISAMLFLGVILTVFGGIALIMGAEIMWLFFDDNAAR